MLHGCLSTKWVNSSQFCKSFRLKELLYKYLCRHMNGTTSLCDSDIKQPVIQSETTYNYWPAVSIISFGLVLTLIAYYRHNNRPRQYIRL